MTDAEIWMVDLDGTGSVHPASKGDPGAASYTRTDTLPTWQPIETLPPAGERPGRVFVVVQGFESHSGMNWLRRKAGIARTTNEGFYSEDIALIEEQDHMEKGSGAVTHWMPWCLPLLPKGDTHD